MVLPIVIIFALVWYFVYYDVLQNAIFKRVISTELGPQGSKLLKAWHAIFFSFSILLGVRFKKEWLIKHHNYLFWVTLQWDLELVCLSPLRFWSKALALASLETYWASNVSLPKTKMAVSPGCVNAICV